MKFIFSRPLVPIALLFASVFLAVVWHLERTASRQKAQEVWREHESVISDVAMRRRVRLSDFREASRFFHELTGIAVPSDHTSFVDAMPNRETATVLEPLRRWYAQNGDRLYWDNEQEKVSLAPPK